MGGDDLLTLLQGDLEHRHGGALDFGLHDRSCSPLEPARDLARSHAQGAYRLRNPVSAADAPPPWHACPISASVTLCGLAWWKA